MKVKIYAPVDCEVFPIEECSDETFAQKMMGEGIVIIPKNIMFNSILNSGKVALVFETKHAIFFEVKNIKILMHIGIDTVKLNGEPFEVFVKENDQINLNTKIVNVNLSKIDRNNLSIQTPICFDNQNIKDVKIKIVNKNAKQGELIAEADITLVEPKKEENDELSIKTYYSKYYLTAKELISNVGGFDNYHKVYNCMTRVRFLVHNVDIVKVDAIKKLELVKGVNFNGQEVQIIIGGECYKVKEEVDKIQEAGGVANKQVSKKDIKKPPLIKRIMGVIAGIMMPQIPALMAVGLFSALYAILQQANVLENYEESINPDVWTTLFYVLSKVGLNLIGVMFCYSTVSYFNGNKVMALLVGLTLSSRIFFAGVSAPSENPGFGDFIYDPSVGVVGWLLFKIGNFPIVLRAYEGSVLPYIFAGVIIVLADKWIKKWMPTSVDVIFRPFLIYGFAILPTMFIFGPVLGLVEKFLSMGIIYLEKDPTGIGVALFGFLWQILVLTGVHVAIVMTILLGTILQSPVIPTALVTVITLATFTQMGATIGVIIRTRNSQLRGIAIGAVPAAVFGITEPIIYAVNLPKIKPFLSGCAGAFVGGLFLKWFGIQNVRPSGMGIFAILAVDGWKNQLLLLLCWFIGIGAAIGFTLLTYEEKVDEYKYSKKIVNKINSKVEKFLIQTGLSKEVAKKETKNISLNYLEAVKKNKEVFKKYMKYLHEKSKLETKLIKIKEKEEKIKMAKYKKAVNFKDHIEKYGRDAAISAIAEYNKYNLDELKISLQTLIDTLDKENKIVISDYQTTVNKLTEVYKAMMNSYVNMTTVKSLQNYSGYFFNALNSSEINYGIIDSEVIGFSKAERAEIKNLISAKQ